MGGFIKLHSHFFDEAEINALVEFLKSGSISSKGQKTQECEELLKRITGAKHVILTSSCTAALEAAARTINLKENDEVIMPSFTMAATASSVLHLNAKPVFADIDRETFCVSPESIKKLISPKTRAIMPVHYAGHSCNMDEIMKIARENNLFVIEDAALAIGAKYKGKSLGTIGDMGCLSFHYLKTVTCGEGGALLTNNDELARKAEVICEFGTNRAAFRRGEVKEYNLVHDKGGNYTLSEILATILVEQLKKINIILEKKRNNFLYLNEGLNKLEKEKKIELQKLTDYAQTNNELFPILIQIGKRDEVIKRLKELGIETAFHYVPLHLSPIGKKLGYKEGQLPVTEEVGKRLIRLPIHANLTRDDLNRIIDCITKVV